MPASLFSKSWSSHAVSFHFHQFDATGYSSDYVKIPSKADLPNSTHDSDVSWFFLENVQYFLQQGGLNLLLQLISSMLDSKSNSAESATYPDSSEFDVCLIIHCELVTVASLVTFPEHLLLLDFSTSSYSRFWICFAAFDDLFKTFTFTQWSSHWLFWFQRYSVASHMNKSSQFPNLTSP
jgi:hypothetical protein